MYIYRIIYIYIDLYIGNDERARKYEKIYLRERNKGEMMMIVILTTGIMIWGKCKKKK